MRKIAFVVVSVVVLVIACMFWQSTHSAGVATHEAAPRIWTPILVTPQGDQMVQPNARRFEFWTPSAKTKDFLTKENGNIRDRDKWEEIPGEERVNEFGNVLRSNPNVLGYRRYEVWGHGRTVPKPGWWWAATVTTNYSIDDFVRAYRGFWKSSNSLFVEVIDNRGREEAEVAPDRVQK
jgi:hypothetical protein